MGEKIKWPHLPPKLQLVVDFVIIALFFSLDARDLIYKTRWLGPSDSYSFTTRSTLLHLEPQPLIPAVNASIPNQKIQRATGWNSFLQKCSSLQAITSDKGVFSHVLATNCDVGRKGQSHIIPQMILASSVRVDSVAWAACKMLFHHRKPPICHSPIVRLFGHRYNMDDKPSLLDIASRKDGTLKPLSIGDHGAYSVEPGSDAELEVIELLQVISLSSPISNAVCVEGFVLEGPGYYTSSMFGCASPNFYHGAFVGHLATGFKQYHQNKAWLTTDTLHLSGMTYMIRENRRSIFVVKGSMDTTNEGHAWSLEHKTQLNFSCFGVLYTLAILIDLVLLVADIYSAIEIATLMLWPLWASLVLRDATVKTGLSSTAKAAFAAEDCQAVLTASLYRSKPIVVLIVIANVLNWMIMVPNAVVIADSVTRGAKTHAWLSSFRFWVLVLISLNAMWDSFVAWMERRAFAFVHGTYITVTEVATITGLVGYLSRSQLLALPLEKYAVEQQRRVDTTSFVRHMAISNAFPEHHDSLQNTSTAVLSVMYAPLVGIMTWSLFAIGLFLLARFAYFSVRYPDELKHHHSSRLFVTASKPPMVVRPDLSGSDSPTRRSTHTDDDDQNDDHPKSLSPPARPPSPKRGLSDAMTAPVGMPTAGDERELRLPLEKVVDTPIRARSLVRSSWKMEKKIGHQVFLRPPQYLEHGILLEGGCMKTRFGFLDVVHPYLRARDHALPLEDMVRTSSSSTAVRRGSFAGIPIQRAPLMPLR